MYVGSVKICCTLRQNLTQFVLRFLISFLTSCSLCTFLLSVYTCKFHEKFLHFLRTYIYFYHHSLDNDRSTVETSCFTVSFYRLKFYEILTYNMLEFLIILLHLFFFLRHLSFQLLFYPMLFFLKFQFHYTFLFIALFKGLDDKWINPQV